MVKPSKTINRIHFEDLDPTRFEDLCANILYQMFDWIEIKQVGKLGR